VIINYSAYLGKESHLHSTACLRNTSLTDATIYTRVLRKLIKDMCQRTTSVNEKLKVKVRHGTPPVVSLYSFKKAQ